MKTSKTKLTEALAVVSECLKDLNKSDKPYFNGNIAKHRFLNEIQELAKESKVVNIEQGAVMFITTLILHHIENEWNNNGNWQRGADKVWNIVRTIDYPRGEYTDDRI